MPMMFSSRGGRGRAMRLHIFLLFRHKNYTFLFPSGAGVDQTGMLHTETRRHGGLQC